MLYIGSDKKRARRKQKKELKFVSELAEMVTDDEMVCLGWKTAADLSAGRGFDFGKKAKTKTWL